MNKPVSKTLNFLLRLEGSTTLYSTEKDQIFPQVYQELIDEINLGNAEIASIEDQVMEVRASERALDQYWYLWY